MSTPNTATDTSYVLRTLVNDTQEWADELIVVDRDYDLGADLIHLAKALAENAATNTSWHEDAETLTIEVWIIPGPIYPGEREPEPVADATIRYNPQTGLFVR